MNGYAGFGLLERQCPKRCRDSRSIEDTQSRLVKKQRSIVEVVHVEHVQGGALVGRRALIREPILIEDDQVPILIEEDQEPILIEDDEEDHSATRKALPRQIHILENDDDLNIKGSGCQYDPITWSEWTTGTIINPTDDGAFFDVSDDEYEDRSRDCIIIGDDKDATNNPEYVHSRDESTIIEAEPTEEVPGLSFSQESAISDGIITLSSSQHSTQGWTNSKEDPRKHVPDLFPTQDMEETNITRAPYSSQKFSSQDLDDQLDKEPLIADKTLDCLPEDFTTTSEKPYDTKPGSQLTGEIETAKVLLEEKKRFFYFTWAPKNLPMLRARIAKFRQNHPETKKEDECWLYTGPLTSIRGRISVSLTFHDDKPPYTKHNHSINVAYLSMIVDGFMTDEFKHGIINHSWHASHLCGNWTCTNPRHIVAESGSINSTRNSCFFRNARTCVHSPPCMKHLRIEPQPGVVEYVRAQRLKDLKQMALEMDFDDRDSLPTL